MYSRIRWRISGRFFYKHKVYPKVIEFFVNIYFALIQDNFLYVTIYVHYYLIAIVIDFLVTVIFFVSIILILDDSEIEMKCRTFEDPDTCIAIFFGLKIFLMILIIIIDIMQVFMVLQVCFSCCI